jgi:hypothetical protein
LSYVQRTLNDWKSVLSCFSDNPAQDMRHTVALINKDQHPVTLKQLWQTGLISKEAMNEVMIAYVSIQEPDKVIL